jgi:predicted nucleotidyltransferase
MKKCDRERGTMIPRTEINLSSGQIDDFCGRHGVRELALFGSVLRQDFRPNSDVDLLVSFLPGSHPSVFELAAMQRELEEIIGRKVDLVDRRVVEESSNYIRRRRILESAEVIYGA